MKVIIDTKEQKPFIFPPDVQTERAGLRVGDYSIAGFTDIIVVERKSLEDFVGCCSDKRKGTERTKREKFKHELLIMRGYPYKAVIIEADLKKIVAGKWHSEMSVPSVLGSLASWRMRYKVDFIYAGNADLASAECLRFLRAYWNIMNEFAKRINNGR